MTGVDPDSQDSLTIINQQQQHRSPVCMMSVWVGIPSLLRGFWDELFYLLSHLASSPHKILAGTRDENR